MGLSRNKVAVPEGAAGTPPFWRRKRGFPPSARRKPTDKKEHLLSGEPAALLPQFVNKRRKLRNIIMSLEDLENLESLDNLEIIESLD